MGAVGAVLGTLAVVVAILVYLLVRVEAAYKFFSGEPVDQRRTMPWMRSLRDERAEFIGVKRKLTGFEKTLIAVVIVAAAASEIWFFFFAGSSIGSG